MTDLFKSRKRHLSPVGDRTPPVAPPAGESGPSLEFALMAAVKHFELGHVGAARVAVADALELLYRGGHEAVDPARFAALLARLRDGKRAA